MFSKVDSDRTPSLTNSDVSSSDSVPTPPSPLPLDPLPHPHKIRTPSFRRKPSGARPTRNSYATNPRPLTIHSPRRSLQATLQSPGVFANLLQFLSTGEFRAITSTCQELRQIFRHAAIKDAVLSHYVPGYRACLLHHDPQQFVDVGVSVGDLHLFRKHFTPSLLRILFIQF